MTDTERIDELERIVLELQAAIGDYHNPIDLSHPPTELPNGEYPLLFRQRQLGVAMDSLVADIEALKQEPTGSVQVPTGTPSEDEVIAILAARGLYLRDGMFGFGGFDPKSAATVQVFGNQFIGDASIQFTHQQGHVATTSLSGDRGFRDLNNQRLLREGYDAVDTDNGAHYVERLETVNPNALSSQIGTDSKHQFSIKRVDPNHPHQHTQDLVLVIDEDSQTLFIKTYRTGWKVALATDAKYGPEKFFRPVFE